MLYVIAAGLVGTGVWRLASWIRLGRPARPRWIATIYAGSSFLAWMSGGLLVLIMTVSPKGPWLIALLGVFLIASSLAWSTSRLLPALRSSGETDIRVFVLAWTRRELKYVRAAISRGARIIAPTGWREVHVGLDRLEDLLGPGALVRGYLLWLMSTPVLLAVTFSWVLETGPAARRRVQGAFVGYNGLSIVSCLTAALLATVVVLTVVTYVRLLNIRLDVREALRAIAVWTGYGTAIGVVTAALLPIMSKVMATRAATTQDGPVSLTPQILIDVPAAFAIVGYVIGIAFALIVIGREAENLLLRRFVAPSVLVAVLVGMVQLDLGPRGILQSMMASAPDVILDCNDGQALSQHLEDPAWLLRAIDACGDGGAYVQDEPFLWSVGAGLALFAVAAFMADFYRGARGKV